MSQFSIGKVIAFVIVSFVLLFVYYRKVLKVKANESKKIEMIKRLCALIILISLLNTFTLSIDDNYKVFILIATVCFINIYNARHIFKYCDCSSISPQYQITQYIYITLITILLGLALKYTNEKGLLSFLYRTQDNIDKIDKDSDKKVSLPDVVVPDYCPDMNKNDYKNNNTSDGQKWIALPKDKQDTCINRNIEKNQRKDISDDIYS